MINNPIDDLLTEIKAEFQSNQSQQNQVNPLTSGHNSLSEKSQICDHSNSKLSGIDQLLSEVKTELNQTNTSEFNYVSVSNTVKSSPLNHHLLDDLKSELITEQQQKLEAEKREEQLKLEEQKQQAELREKRRKEALTQKAKQWLKNLDPKSEEGIWFEDFSYNYEDKLQAAIDYLEALKEVNFQ